VVGLGVKLTVGALVDGADVDCAGALVVVEDGIHAVSHSDPLNPLLHLQTCPWQTPFPEQTAVRNLLAGAALLSPLKLALAQLWLTVLAGDALLSPLRLASQYSTAG